MTISTIPEQLQGIPHWVLFKVIEGKKIPFMSLVTSKGNRRKAKHNDPRTWSSFDTASRIMNRYPGTFDGLGYVFSKLPGHQDTFTGIDLDDCYVDGELLRGAAELVERCGSYAERSVSGRGAHIILEGSLPDGITKKSAHLGEYAQRKTELFSSCCYFATTGVLLPGSPQLILPGQDTIDDLYARMVSLAGQERPGAHGEPRRRASRATIAPERLILPPQGKSHLTDEEVREKLFTKCRDRISVLECWHGNWSRNRFESESEASAFLASWIVFYCAGDVEQSTKIFRQSNLYRQKCARRLRDTTWLDWLIRKTAATAENLYSPHWRPSRKRQTEPAIDRVISALEEGAATGAEIQARTGLSKPGVFHALDTLRADSVVVVARGTGSRRSPFVFALAG